MKRLFLRALTQAKCSNSSVEYPSPRTNGFVRISNERRIPFRADRAGVRLLLHQAEREVEDDILNEVGGLVASDLER